MFSKLVSVDKSPQSNISSLEGYSIPQAIGRSISELCRSLPITKIVAITVSGYAARTISSQMLRQPIIAISNDPLASKSFNLYRGTIGVYANINFSKNNLEHVSKCLELLWAKKMISEKDMILVTAVGYPLTGRRMNMIQTHHVRDLKDLFNWKTN